MLETALAQRRCLQVILYSHSVQILLIYPSLESHSNASNLKGIVDYHKIYLEFIKLVTSAESEKEAVNDLEKYYHLKKIMYYMESGGHLIFRSMIAYIMCIK